MFDPRISSLAFLASELKYRSPPCQPKPFRQKTTTYPLEQSARNYIVRHLLVRFFASRLPRVRRHEADVGMLELAPCFLFILVAFDIALNQFCSYCSKEVDYRNYYGNTPPIDIFLNNVHYLDIW